MIETEGVVGVILSLEFGQLRQLPLAVDLLQRLVSPRVVLVDGQIVIAGGGSQVFAECNGKLVGRTLNGVAGFLPYHLDHAVEKSA